VKEELMRIKVRLPIVLEVVDYKSMNALAPLGKHLIIAIPIEDCEIVEDEEDES